MIMKKIIVSIIFSFVLFSLFAQSNYNEAIQQGDNALKLEDYTTAIKKYLIAETFDQSQWKIVEDKLDAVYSIINNKQKELQETISELKIITEHKEELEHKLSSAKEEVEQIKHKLENLESQVRNVLQAMDTIMFQTSELKNRLLQTKNINNDK